jgi:hypothetical protein
MIHADFGFSLTHTILQIIDFLAVFLDTPILSGVVGLQGADTVPKLLDHDLKIVNGLRKFLNHSYKSAQSNNGRNEVT